MCDYASPATIFGYYKCSMPFWSISIFNQLKRTAVRWDWLWSMAVWIGWDETNHLMSFIRLIRKIPLHRSSQEENAQNERKIMKVKIEQKVRMKLVHLFHFDALVLCVRERELTENTDANQLATFWCSARKFVLFFILEIFNYFLCVCSSLWNYPSSSVKTRS